MNTADITAIGEYFRARRKQMRLTQQDVAEGLGVSPQAVSKWERGENLPDMGLMPDIAGMLQCSVDELLRAGVSDGGGADAFVYLTAGQKAEVIARVLAQEDYGEALDDILPYCNMAHRADILRHILRIRDYGMIEQISTYMSNEMKRDILAKLLREGRFDIIEDNMPAFNRKHRELIVDHFADSGADMDIIENFVPFFDNNQRARLKAALYDKEELL